MTDEELRELRQLLLTNSAFGMKAAMVKWISSVLERRLAAAQAVGPTANYTQNTTAEEQRLLARGFVPGQPATANTQKVGKASIAVTCSGFRKGG